MEEFVAPLSWVLVLILLGAGPRLPGGLYFWTGIVVIIVGFSALASPTANWPFQMAFVVLYVIGRHFLKNKIRGMMSGDSATYDSKGSNKGKHVGKMATVTKAVRGGFGMVTIKDDPWRVRSDEDIPAGAMVKVVGTDGEFLQVARVEELA